MNPIEPWGYSSNRYVRLPEGIHRGKEKIGGKDGSWQVTESTESKTKPVGFGMAGYGSIIPKSSMVEEWYMYLDPWKMVDFLWIGKYTGIPVPWSQVWVYILVEKDLFPGDS